MKRRVPRRKAEQQASALLQQAASIEPGTREALQFCFGRLAEFAEELKQLETLVEQADALLPQEVGLQPPAG